MGKLWTPAAKRLLTAGGGGSGLTIYEQFEPDSSSWSANDPTGVVGIEAGDLIIVMTHTGGAGTGEPTYSNTPAGYTMIQTAFSSNHTSAMFWKTADGTETGTLFSGLTASNGSSQTIHGVTWVVKGHGFDTPVVSHYSSGDYSLASSTSVGSLDGSILLAVLEVNDSTPEIAWTAPEGLVDYNPPDERWGWSSAVMADDGPHTYSATHKYDNPRMSVVAVKE